MRKVSVTPVLFLLLVGCSRIGSAVPDSTGSEPPSQTAPLQPDRTTPRTEAPFIEIAPEARLELMKIAEAQNVEKWWLRITIKSSGPQGITPAIDLDVAGPERSDTEHWCGQVFCLTATDQDFLIQGARVGWTKNEREFGFSVTFPNKTAENQAKTKTWVEEESRARRDRRMGPPR